MGSDRWYVFSELICGDFEVFNSPAPHRKKVQLHNYLGADEAWNWAISIDLG